MARTVRGLKGKHGFGVTADITILMRTPKAITADVLREIEPAFIKNAENVRRDASRIALAKGVFDTGLTFNSLGWAISRPGETKFGPLHTTGTGEQNTDAVFSNSEDLSTIVATSSGYGGFVEVGAQQRTARPFITEAALQNVAEFGRLLTGIIK